MYKGEAGEGERIKKQSTADMENKKKERKKDKEENSIDNRRSALNSFHFGCFPSLSLCLRQRSDQTESTISEAITSDGRSDNKNIYIDDPASLFCTIFCTIVSKVSK